MENLTHFLRDIQSLDLFSISQESAFWLGFFCCRSNTLASSTMEAFQSLDYLSRSDLLNQTLKSFLTLSLINDKSRFEALYSIFTNTYNEYSVLQELSNSETAELQTISNIFELPDDSQPNQNNIENPLIVQDEYIDYNNPNLRQDSQSFFNYYEEIANIPDYQEPEPELECKICLENISIHEFVPLSSCACFFHAACLNKFLNIEIEQRKIPINCPNCKIPLNEQDVFDRIEPAQKTRYLEYQFNQFVVMNSKEYSCCPTPDCRNVFIAEEQNHFACDVCKNEYCLRCKTSFHVGQSCEQYQQSVIDKKTQSADDQFMKFVKGTNYKMCPSCKFWVEKSSGCNHMVCRCRYEFCYACGGKYNACACVKNARY